MKLMNLVCLIFILIVDMVYMVSDAFLAKVLASALFVVLAMINFLYAKTKRVEMKYPKRLLVALVFSFLGDVFLVHRFVMGALFFAIAHMFYFLAYVFLEELSERDFLYGMVISVLSILVIVFVPILSFESSLIKVGCCFYAMCLSFMFGKAISNVTRKNRRLYQMILLGSGLFFFSDAMLLLKVAGNLGWATYACLGTYYLGQWVLAYSMLIYTDEESRYQNRYLQNNSKMI